MRLEIREHRKTPSGGFMMAGAKRLAGIDFERERTVGNFIAMNRRMDEKLTFADRFQPLLADNCPVFIAKMGDDGFGSGRTWDKTFCHPDGFVGRCLFKIDIEPPLIGCCRINLAGHQDRDWFQEGKGSDIVLEYFRFGSGAGEGEFPAIGQN